MESKEKCEQIIQMFNGKALSGAKDPLLVKFADGGNKKKSLYKSTIWRETGEVIDLITVNIKECVMYMFNDCYIYFYRTWL